jgi:NADPH:quinone reductase-like Zn-dependent oxidoreductase
VETSFIGNPNRLRSQAYRLYAYGGPDVMRLDDVAVPPFGETDVLVHVMAAGVNGLDWKLRDGLLKTVRPLVFPATLGLELAGVVVGVGRRTSRFTFGGRVFGPLVDGGAYADFVAVGEAEPSRTPAELHDVEAAALPVATLTAWQALEAGGGARRGKTILVTGAAGAVGGFAVQFAKKLEATVFATASTVDCEHVRNLGADAVISYETQRFEDRFSGVDVVLDLVGGDTVERSWSVLRAGGTIVSTVDPSLSIRMSNGLRAVGLQMNNDVDRLEQFADRVASGTLKSTIGQVVGRFELADAIERNKRRHAPGKTVVDLTS